TESERTDWASSLRPRFVERNDRCYRSAMAKPTAVIKFKAKLSRPATPVVASAKLPTRSMVTVEGNFEDHPFQATLEPDGQGSHWLKIDKALRESAGVAAGDRVALEIAPVEKEPEPKVPADLRKALASNAEAKATWVDITPVARRDWIHWITSGKKAETRGKRIATACDKLACGKRNACCFDRSGMYSKGSMGAPEAAE